MPLYRSHMVSPLGASPLPKLSYLIGWYKLNEGIGAVAANSATDGSGGGGLLPNLSVWDSDGSFWTLSPGFGASHVMHPKPVNHAYKKLPSPRVFGGSGNGYACWAGFYNRIDPSFVGGKHLNIHTTALNSGYGFAVHQIAAASMSAVYPTSSSVLNAATLNNWFFHFVANDNKIYAVKSDGTLLTAIAAGGGAKDPIDMQYIHIGAISGGGDDDGSGDRQSTGGGGAYGDMLIFNFIRLTVAEWAEYYDQLRSRYGMSARSGW